MRYFFRFFLMFIFLVSCQKESKINIDTSSIEINFSVDRFEEFFYNLEGGDFQKTGNLQALKKKYPLMFPANTPDSVWVAKINDKDERELFAETQKLYKDFSGVEDELTELFKHVKYYYPKFEAPDVITVLSNIDYEYRVVYADLLLFISIDVYLGGDHPFYADYPDYIKVNNKKERIVVDVADKIIDVQMLPSLNRSFLGKMISAGKRLYVLDAYLPNKSDELKIGYAKEKLNWAKDNEDQIWRYFIEKDLLYSTDTRLNKRFLEEAPFSKFYLAEDSNSPGRIGQWVGWQIVRSFMENNDVSLQTLLEMNEDEIFQKSNYKPKK